MLPNKHRTRFYSEQIGDVESRQWWPSPTIIHNLALCEDIPELFLDKSPIPKQLAFGSKTLAPDSRDMKRALFLEMVEDVEEPDDTVSVDSFELMLESRKEKAEQKPNQGITPFEQDEFPKLEDNRFELDFEPNCDFKFLGDDSKLLPSQTHKKSPTKNQGEKSRPRDQNPDAIEDCFPEPLSKAKDCSLSREGLNTHFRRGDPSALSGQLGLSLAKTSQPTDPRSGFKGSVLLLQKRSQPTSAGVDDKLETHQNSSSGSALKNREKRFGKLTKEKNPYEDFRFNLRVTKDSILRNRLRTQSWSYTRPNTIFEFLQKK